MTDTEQQLYMLRGMMSVLSKDEQSKIEGLVTQIRDIVDSNAEYGVIAATLVVGQLAVENDD